MCVDIVPNRNSPPAVLLSEGWRENGKVRKRTIANLSSWPMEKVETLRRLLKNEPLVSRADAFDIVRSLPHGHVAAVLGTLKKLDRRIDPKPSPRRDRVLALIVARHPLRSWPRGWPRPPRRVPWARSSRRKGTTSTTPGSWSARRGSSGLWRHLEEGCLVLLTSVWMEGRKCPLARRGHSRDGKKGKLQSAFCVIGTGVGAGVPRQHGGSGHGVLTDRHAAGAVLPREGGGGPGDQGARGGQACGPAP